MSLETAYDPPMRPFIRAPDEGLSVENPVGGILTFKATGDETGGAFTAIETVAAPREGPPIHVHDEDELIYIIEGEFRVKLGDTTAPLQVGLETDRGHGATPRRGRRKFARGWRERFWAVVPAGKSGLVEALDRAFELRPLSMVLMTMNWLREAVGDPVVAGCAKAMAA
jgi:hypothetical protein